nr:MAG TPA: BclA protein [Caudoviricetes sp.]
MSCNSRFKNAHYKSAQNAYNNTPQTFVAAGTPVNVLGILNTDTGCSLDTVAGGFVVNNSGLYRISYDVVFTAGGAGVAELKALKDTVSLPCADAQVTTVSGNTYTLHVETTVYIAACCNGTPTISAALGGVEGTINHVCASMVKLA